MRLNCNLKIPARVPQKEPVPFKEILPLRLKETVSGKGDKTSDVACLHEMSIMFACFKNNEFNQELCSKEISSFQNCYKDFQNKKNIKKRQEQKGILIPGEKNLTHKQLNTLLRRFPPQ
ncbi:coiled-coil-helix-coiled-coil-helix domain-containing protein 1 [Zootermopsis nevadensis]|uniref:Coiled-coil-helix-coiled-coil-helix domain-containing protein 1 n=1 Tax=Zootermopsis nevadensis TaxID=136037 RepID=A0A067RKY7_ZOONE|nr:coiled-coil-helix-coiled-coil-helix domain-containing protein 1 [Zootermopsis nevadensis]KDR21265.1 Coiled-coil-helix-coiled-coil-helix domain-containing protein 1 [Zootermopsis nevadensis]